MNHFFHTTKHDQKGFTLVELMVSLSLFVIVVLALVSSLYTVNDASKKVQAMRAVMDNLNFAMESMSRTVRTGTEFTCGGGYPTSPQNCSLAQVASGQRQPASALTVKGTLGTTSTIEYSWVLDPVSGRGSIQKKIDGGQSVSITAPEIDVQRLVFYVDGAENDQKQPSVVIMVEGVATAGDGNTAPFAIQTYLSQRATE